MILLLLVLMLAGAITAFVLVVVLVGFLSSPEVQRSVGIASTELHGISRRLQGDQLRLDIRRDALRLQRELEDELKEVD